MAPGQIVVLAAPFFLLLIALEFAWGCKSGRNTYRLNDAINSISLGMLSQGAKVVTRLLQLGLYGAVSTTVSLVPTERATAFWTTWYGWLLALVFYDFCYYWLHRAGHECALFWAAHAVHHQSQDFNLSTGVRHSSSGILAALFYLPLALAGVPPLVFGTVAAAGMLYQFWVHTEHIGRLGWFDLWFSSPSNHRVHHAVNDGYVKRNYGAVLIVWDRLFGSYAREGERCVYGTRRPLNSWDPLWSNVAGYWELLKASWYAGSWIDKLRVWFKSPDWLPADVAARFPQPPFDYRKQERYHPPLTPQLAWFGAIQFTLLLPCMALFLWHADTMPLSQSAVWLAALAAGLWSLGAVLQGRITIMEVLLIETAALATATGTEHLVLLHRVFTPLALAIGFAIVARARQAREGSVPHLLLLAGLWFALIGDSLLTFPGLVVPGLVSLLAAHLAYIAVLALMAAQTTGLAGVLRDKPMIAVAAGACLFLASDALLAVNTFLLPLPMERFLVLATYDAAQVLIVAGMVRAQRPA